MAGFDGFVGHLVKDLLDKTPVDLYQDTNQSKAIGGHSKLNQKIKLPEEVCVALDKLKPKTYGLSHLRIATMIIDKSNSDFHISYFTEENADTLLKAIMYGYESDLLPEQRMKQNWEMPYYMKNMSTSEAYQEGIKSALRIHGIKYDWMFNKNDL